MYVHRIIQKRKVNVREKPIGIYATEIQCDRNIKIMKKNW